MKLLVHTPKQSLNKAYLKQRPLRSQMDLFKSGLIGLIDRIDEKESEEFHKNLVSDFLKKAIYQEEYFINTKGRQDLVVHNGKDNKTQVGVILEAKRPSNKADWFTPEKPNGKAIHELVLYYLRERIEANNIDLKYLVATNINEWYIIEASYFEKLFYKNKALVKHYEEWRDGQKVTKDTGLFYNEIVKPFIDELKEEIPCTYFKIQDYEKVLRNEDQKDDKDLIALLKVLSPNHLLKVPFANDSNSLDKRFYSELLHIIGLTEVKEGGKKLIERHKTGERHSGTLLESAIVQLDSLDKLNRLDKPSQFGSTREEQYFNVGLELCITWINRILFLKLMEAQLIAYHKGDKSYTFLTTDKIKNYDDLNSLFFQVLARQSKDRVDDVKKVFEKVPYLNSSLFEPTDLEQITLFISNLKDDREIPLHSQSVLKDKSGKKRTGSITALEYLFEFLNAYDFSGEGSEEVQEDNKTLINASVLGLIFEKINGYKDGSFFTPGFITMYMCRETIRKAVVQKFNDTKKWSIEKFEDLYDKIEDRKEANDIVNSLKICDPAVGSGHFLVSALNEIISIKNDLKILSDRNGKRLKEYHVEVVNDELVVTDEEGDLFEYNPSNKESQRIQETLFHEKETIIEKCLFGVDINPNSVKICRLRLWIELLKSAYYKNATELETLPNIDINIKCGNSLVSRFAIDSDLKQALKKSKWTIDGYKLAVDTYRNAENKEQKREMERLIDDIKSDFKSNIDHPFKKKISEARGKVDNLASKINTEKQWGNKIDKKLIKNFEDAVAKLQKLEKEKDEIESNKIYENAFEWRFEFPEVLNDEGDFVGFDVVIGNPPYIRQEGLKDLKTFFMSQFKLFTGTADLYIFFIEKGFNVLKNKGVFTFIMPNKFMQTAYGKPARKFLLEQNLIEIIDFGDFQVFEEATTYPCILIASKENIKGAFKTTKIHSPDFINNFTNF
ncbi:MAG TPA: Eco57I restriction-modification methylase domain-containing protein, partial [Bacteroidia bacterium]